MIPPWVFLILAVWWAVILLRQMQWTRPRIDPPTTPPWWEPYTIYEPEVVIESDSKVSIPLKPVLSDGGAALAPGFYSKYCQAEPTGLVGPELWRDESARTN